ncbi:MAG: hypothetical protein HYZ14_00460 [Bacteroidetes bacterium]|nr:hypothetical protein [Bacteroidota bacterium]
MKRKEIQNYKPWLPLSVMLNLFQHLLKTGQILKQVQDDFPVCLLFWISFAGEFTNKASPGYTPTSAQL